MKVVLALTSILAIAQVSFAAQTKTMSCEDLKILDGPLESAGKTQWQTIKGLITVQPDAQGKNGYVSVSKTSDGSVVRSLDTTVSEMSISEFGSDKTIQSDVILKIVEAGHPGLDRSQMKSLTIATIKDESSGSDDVMKLIEFRDRQDQIAAKFIYVSGSAGVCLK